MRGLSGRLEHLEQMGHGACLACAGSAFPTVRACQSPECAVCRRCAACGRAVRWTLHLGGTPDAREND